MADALRQEEKSKTGASKVFRISGIILMLFLVTASIIVSRSVFWVLKTWDNLSIEEIIFHLKVPLEGTNSDMIRDYLVYVGLFAAAALVILLVLLRIMKNKRMKSRVLLSVMGVSVAVAVFSVGYIWKNLGISEYLDNQNQYSGFIDENYVAPSDDLIEFPEQKKNLVYIYLESMEVTFADEENGGAFSENVIPELTQLSEENENFAGENGKLNGAVPLKGSTWTMGAMFGQTSGLPLLIPIDQNSMNTQEDFLPGVTALGDILKEAGYQQTLLIGSEAVFGGREMYFQEHGGYEICDYDYYKDNGYFSEDYRVWWGFEDEKLFSYAKEKINDLSASGQPFNLTILTADTHFEDGYLCENCGNYFDDQYSNVMACSSSQVAEFVSWLQQQPCYENTVIVISGDHLTMDSDFCDDVSDEYQRKVYTTYIHSSAEPESDEYREYSTFDLFPTTLASLGVKIEGDRLALGTNLFSSEKTLLEQYGKSAVEEGLMQKSLLMEEFTEHVEEISASAECLAYDEKTQQITIRVDDISSEKVDGVRGAVNINGETLWSDGIQEGDGYLIRLSAEGAQPGVYSVAVYGTVEGNLGPCMVSVDVNVMTGSNGSDESTGLPDDWVSGTHIEIMPYDEQLGLFSITVTSDMDIREFIPCIRCAVWKEPDQSDLLWYEASWDEYSQCTFNFFSADFPFDEGIYQVHVYAVSSEEEMTMLGENQIKIAELPES